MKPIIAHEIKVGIFVVVGIALFCISIILLGGDRMFFTRMYELRVRLPQVQGIGEGSVVSLTGVQIGNVAGIQFIEGSSDVELVLNIEYNVMNRITEGSKASMKTQGALGDKYVYIEPGPRDAPPLKEGAIIDTDKTPDLLDIIASKGAELGEIVEVIKEVRLLFENINKDGRSAKLMTSLIDSSDQFSKFMTEARETFKLMRNDTLLPLSSVMKKIDSGQGTLGALVNDQTLHNRINGFFGEQPRNRFLKPLIRESIQTSEQKK